MIDRRIQCLALICFVLVWDLVAVRWSDAPPSPTETSVSRCDVLPLAARYRQQALESIDLATLPAGSLPCLSWPAKDGLPNSLPPVTHARMVGADLLYSLKSLQR